MKYQDFIFRDAADSSTQVTVKPDWGFAENHITQTTRSEAITGRTYTYKPSNARAFSFTLPLNFVADSDTQLINEFWTNGTKLHFEMDQTSNATVVGKFINKNKPLTVKQGFEQDLYKGVLFFRSIENSPEKTAGVGGPFQLDHPLLGKLDGLTNPLN